ncbi:hypothetical protein B0H16DRAFT_1478127 [Mycena metata]|uniref:F-box domain-containing protein n=1 Tax=Mycena metata TaxID=1033252 RepID=A0AAD7MET1_9AGAR|nr:hypothetical protein B0H16DRAFT_1478127 [Mycena metata]
MSSSATSSELTATQRNKLFFKQASFEVWTLILASLAHDRPDDCDSIESGLQDRNCVMLSCSHFANLTRATHAMWSNFCFRYRPYSNTTFIPPFLSGFRLALARAGQLKLRIVWDLWFIRDHRFGYWPLWLEISRTSDHWISLHILGSHTCDETWICSYVSLTRCKVLQRSPQLKHFGITTRAPDDNCVEQHPPLPLDTSRLSTLIIHIPIIPSTLTGSFSHPQLTTLELNKHGFPQWRKFIRECSNLETLRWLARTRVPPTNEPSLSMPSIRSLTIQTSVDLPPIVVVNVTEFKVCSTFLLSTQHLIELQVLDWFYPFSFTQFTAFFGDHAIPTRIRHLDLFRTRIGDGDVLSVLARCPELVALRLQGSTVDADRASVYAAIEEMVTAGYARNDARRLTFFDYSGHPKTHQATAQRQLDRLSMLGTKGAYEVSWGGTLTFDRPETTAWLQNFQSSPYLNHIAEKYFQEYLLSLRSLLK